MDVPGRLCPSLVRTSCAGARMVCRLMALDSAARTARTATAALPPSGRWLIHHYVHGASFELDALQRVDSESGGGVIKLDDGKAAGMARTVPRDPQRVYLAEGGEEGLQIAGGSISR